MRIHVNHLARYPALSVYLRYGNCVGLFVALLVGAIGSVATAAPLTIMFYADRDVAGIGEKVHWTIWAELPEDAPPNSEILGFTGDFRPRNLFSGVAARPTALAFAERTQPVIEGAALSGVEIARTHSASSLPRQIPLYTFVTEMSSAQRPLWYDLDATVLVSSPQGVLFYQRDDGQSTLGEPIRVHSDTVNMRGCGQADIAEPFGDLNTADIERFVEFFHAGAPIADIVSPFGVVDFGDLSRFMQLYSVGCYQSR